MNNSLWLSVKLPLEEGRMINQCIDNHIKWLVILPTLLQPTGIRLGLLQAYLARPNPTNNASALSALPLLLVFN